MARKRNKIIPKPVLFICCEGTSTEYNYFKSISELDDVSSLFQNIGIYPRRDEESIKNDPYSLVKIAAEMLSSGSADIAWAVFDKNGHGKLPEAFKLASESGVKIAFSSRSFEEWILLHFEKSDFQFNVSECKTIVNKKKIPLACGTVGTPACLDQPCLSGHIRRQGYINNYNKTSSFNLFSILYTKSEFALINAAWLRYRANASLFQNRVTPLYRLNPYTDVDQLFYILHNKNDKIEWGLHGNNITLNNFIINANISGNNVIAVISHNKPQAIVMNFEFPGSIFYYSDNLLNQSMCNVISQRILLNNNNNSTLNILYPNDQIEFTLSFNNQPYLVFEHSHSHAQIFVELY